MNRIYQQALYYSNIPLRDRSIKAVVHLENTDDVPFWNNQLQEAHPGRYPSPAGRGSVNRTVSRL